MAIDECRYSFVQMTRDVLPEYMAKLRVAMESPHTMTLFTERGIGPRAIARQLGLDTTAFSGCYVFMNPQPIYVGISQNVIRRLRQHVRGTTHFDASLAYRMATAQKQHTMTRQAAMLDSEFRDRFDLARHYLSGLDVAFMPIANPLELYLFEAYCAMELDTSEWNTFKTH